MSEKDIIVVEAVVARLLECLAAGLQASMEARGAHNYAAFSLSDEAGGNQFLAVFMRAPNGKTPMELQALAEARAEKAEARVAHLERFKALVHERLDALGVDPCAGAECRVGARFDRLLQDALRPILARTEDIDLTTCVFCGCQVFNPCAGDLACCDACAQRNGS